MNSDCSLLTSFDVFNNELTGDLSIDVVYDMRCVVIEECCAKDSKCLAVNVAESLSPDLVVHLARRDDSWTGILNFSLTDELELF